VLLIVYFSILINLSCQQLHAQNAVDSLVLAATDTSYLSQAQPKSMTGYFFKAFVFTLVIIVLIYSVLILYKKFGGQPIQGTQTKIRILSRQNIGPKQSSVIVVIEHKKYALGVADHSVNLIAQLGEISADEISQSESAQIRQNFSSILEKLKKGK